MTYHIRLSKAIRNKVRKLPGNVRNIARRRITSLMEQPRPYDAKELDGHSGYYRIWIMGQFRLVWQVIDDEQMVDILYIGPKSPDLYTYLGLARPSERNE